MNGTDHTTNHAPLDGVTIAYETFGEETNPTVLLVAGLGAQLISWDDDLCRLLADCGWHVVRYDNRDVGLSTHLSHLGPADLVAVSSGRASAAPYGLADLAGDAVGLLDHLNVRRAHVVGVSMGGMIAQTMAIEFPQRLASLVSIMSTTGPAVAPPTPEAAAVLTPPAVHNVEEAKDQSVAAARITGSPGHPFDEDRIRRRAAAAYERSFDPAGVGRQLAAILAAEDRAVRLGEIDVPTLVIHGADDALVPVTGGKATASAISGARLEIIEGMGHDVPVGLFDRVVRLVDAHCRRAEQAHGGSTGG